MKHHIHPGSTGAVQLVERQAHSSEQLADTAKLQVTQVMLEGWIARAKKGKAEHARQKCKNRRRIGFWTGMISTRLNWTSKVRLIVVVLFMPIWVITQLFVTSLDENSSIKSAC